MTTRQGLMAMTAAVLLAAPASGFAQGPAGSSAAPQTTQTGPRDGGAGAPATGNTAPERPTPPAASAPGNAPGGGTPGGGTATPAPAAGARPGGGGATPPAATTAPGTFAVDSGVLRSGRRAGKVIGSTVYNENNESIGEVDDILIPPGGSAPVAVISVGGFLGIGAKLVAVPFDRLQAAGGSGSRWTLTGATKDSLGSLPTFAYDTSGDRRG